MFKRHIQVSMCVCVCVYFCQCFINQGQFCPSVDFEQCLVQRHREGRISVFQLEKPQMLLSILMCKIPLPLPKTNGNSVKNINSVKVEKSCN